MSLVFKLLPLSSIVQCSTLQITGALDSHVMV